MEYAETGQEFYGLFEKDLREGIGYMISQNDNRIYCGQYRQDREDGVGEYLSVKNIQNVFKSVDFKKHEIIKDKIYKICKLLSKIGNFNYDSQIKP